jgi:hypothetical protein
LSGDTSCTIQEQRHIVARLCPDACPAWRRRLATWRYRLHNLPRYLERLRTVGWRSSYQVLDPQT